MFLCFIQHNYPKYGMADFFRYMLVRVSVIVQITTYNIQPVVVVIIVCQSLIAIKIVVVFFCYVFGL